MADASATATVANAAQAGSGGITALNPAVAAATVANAAQQGAGSATAAAPTLTTDAPRAYLEDGPTLRVALFASESLAQVRDFYGTAAQVSLFHLETLTRYSAAVYEATAETPDIPADVFYAERANAALLPFGSYRVEALLLDVAGNRRVIGEVEGRLPSDPVSVVEFRFLERRVRRWFNVRSADRTTTFYSDDRTTSYRATEVL